MTTSRREQERQRKARTANQADTLKRLTGLAMAAQASDLCQVREDGYCARHERWHKGREYTLALDPGLTGKRYRRYWDQQAGITTKPVAKIPLACIYRGAETRRVRCPSCRGEVHVKVHDCSLHGECQLTDKPIDGIKRCRNCRDRQDPDAAAAPPPRAGILPATTGWISTQQLTVDTLRLGAMLPPDITAVAGIPRSGLIPAAILAAHYHLPLWQLTEQGQLSRLGHGSRGRNLKFKEDGGRLLVIDDTAYGGTAMRKARLALKDKPAVFAVIYARHEARSAVDLYARLLPSPHLLEWNAFNNGPFGGHGANPIYGRGFALDLDGVICENPPAPDADDDGPALTTYRSWLLTAKPKWLPRTLACRAIITARLERWRTETTAWLAKWHVPFEQLFMHPAERASERELVAPIAAWKADIYRESGCGFYVESDAALARQIAGLARKPVIHPDSGQVFR